MNVAQRSRLCVVRDFKALHFQFKFNIIPLISALYPALRIAIVGHCAFLRFNS